jgi:hypothetical protein
VLLTYSGQLKVCFGVCQEKSDTINGALRRLAVSGSNQTKMLFNGESNAEEQYQNHSVSLRYSDSFPLAGLCASASRDGSLSGHGSSRPVFDSGRER